MSALLSIDAVSKRFRGLLAVDNVSFRVAQGSIFAVIGPNGAGKTTLFDLIAGMSAPDRGSIAFAGERIDGLTPDEICRRGARSSWCDRSPRFRSKTMSPSVRCYIGTIPRWRAGARTRCSSSSICSASVTSRPRR